MKIAEKTSRIKKLLLEAGFDKAGIAPAALLPKVEYLKTWLAEGRHGEMHWMENYLDKRLDIRKLYPEARSVIMAAHNYYTPDRHSTDKSTGKISRYAWGRDYHTIIKKKLKKVLQQFRELDPQMEGRIFTDTAPVQEKLWAAQAGLGWQGKHTNLITREYGSWVFLGGIVINQELEYDNPVQDFCGRCTACIDACPTAALKPYQMDARRCLSYLTIEYWDKAIPSEFSTKMENWVFGCDICQDVCPWNSNAKLTAESRYHPAAENVTPSLNALVTLNETAFKTRFKKSPVYRAKYQNFIRNVKTVIQNNKANAGQFLHSPLKPPSAPPTFDTE